MLVSDSQLRKALPLMVVTELGITTLASDLQPQKALPPIFVTGKPFICDGILTKSAEPLYFFMVIPTGLSSMEKSRGLLVTVLPLFKAWNVS